MKKTLLAVLLGAMAAQAAMTAKTSWTQRWPWDTKVDIDFELAGDGKCDVAVTATFTTNGVPVELDLEGAALTGGTWELRSGFHHVVWDPARAGLDAAALKGFSVSVTPVENAAEARAWLVYDMVKGSYAYCALGEEPRNAAGKPWQDGAYKGVKMVFRRIPAGKFTMGYTPEQLNFLKGFKSDWKGYSIEAHEVEIMSDYYVAIYPITRDQAHYALNADYTGHDSYAAFHGLTSQADLYAAGGGYTCFIRGSNAVDGITWPATKFKVKEESWAGRLRTRSGRRLMFDLATAAQWQKAARPDADALWYKVDGKTDGGKVGDDVLALSNALAVVSQVYVQVPTSYNQPGTVGMYAPNRYGIYDTVAARPEHVLDQYDSGNTTDYTQTVDPVGVSTSPDRGYCFGAFVRAQNFLEWSMCVLNTNTTRRDGSAADVNNMMPFRFAIHLKPPRAFEGKWE